MLRTCLFALGIAVFAFAPAFAADKEEAKFDPAKLVGTWSYVSGEQDGKKKTADDLKKGTVEITKDTITLKSDEGVYVIKYTLDTKKTPVHISMEITKGPQGEGSKAEGILEFKGEELKICYPPMGGDTPKEFSAKEGSKLNLFVLKLKK